MQEHKQNEEPKRTKDDLLQERIAALKLAPDTLSGFKKVFDALDKDESGTLTKDEIKLAAKELGRGTLSDQQLTDVFDAVDENKNGALDFDEFIKTFARMTQVLLGSMAAAFQALDTDGNGYVTKDEIKITLQEFGQKCSDEKVNHMLEGVDKDGDGKINIVEFMSFMQKFI